MNFLNFGVIQKIYDREILYLVRVDLAVNSAREIYSQRKEHRTVASQHTHF